MTDTASPAAPAVSAKKSRGLPIWRWVGLSQIVVLALVLGGLIAAISWWSRSLPQTTGEISLSGLSASVQVTRDSHGVPHVQAANLADAWQAMGFLHAQDRFFQMELQRRAGAGRLSEIFGAMALAVDKLYRTLGFYRAAKADFAAMSPEFQQILSAYTAGVNAWLQQNQQALPLEFTLLGYTPEPWQPADSLVWGKLMAWQLSGNASLEAFRGQLRARYSEAEVERFFPPLQDQDPITTRPTFAALPAPVSLPAASPAAPPAEPTSPAADEPPTPAPDQQSRWQQLAPQLAAIQQQLAKPMGASNHWAVSGAKSASGAPLLANDPHLGLELPMLWYLATITTPEVTLTGATVAGVPLLLLGHNQHIAWGFTTSYIDTQDLFIETRDPTRPNYYLTQNGSLPLERRTETIDVKGAPAETITIEHTRHGPVLNDYPNLREEALTPDQFISLAFIGLQSPDLSAEALYRLNLATDWPAADRAMQQYLSPSQNLLLIDRAGTIAYRAIGRVPVRQSGNGRYPADGASGQFDWVGNIPDQYLPRLVNPAGGVLANANNRLVGVDYVYTLGRDWAENYRARRLEQLLQGERFSLNDFARIQHDQTSAVFADWRPYVELLATPDATATAAKALLLAWDGNTAAERPEPLIFNWWLRQLNLRLLSNQLDDVLGETGAINATVLLQALRQPANQFCAKPPLGSPPDCAPRLQQAWQETLAELTSRYGSDVSSWRWGNEHRAPMANRVLDKVPVLGPLFSQAFPSGGDDYTLDRGGNAGTSDTRHPLERTRGGGFRGLYDAADFAQSRFSIAGGQSAHPLSPHYADLLQLWRRGESITLAPSTQGARLVLTPAAP